MTDAMMCRLFPSTLEDASTDCYEELPPRSISSFDMMVEKFVKYFSIQKKRKKEVDALQDIVQKKGERLTEFLRRFNHAALRI